MLVGPSSTGKSRACWEAIRAVLPDWHVWHPLTPERPAAVVEALQEPGRIKPRTVIWLNEAQMYLQPSGIGERVAAALQGLLNDPASAPVVILGSMWSDYWRTLTRPRRDDAHAAARALLRIGCDIAVAAEFTSADIAGNARRISEDPRLRLAAKHGGQRITQYLAGVPELIRRYEHASEHARAVVWAAMDARRLSRWLYLPREFLVKAAPGYLDRQVWDQTADGEEWFDQALSDLTELCHGVPGPLSRSRPLPDEPIPMPLGYRLADYLEQVGRRERARLCPPRTFWTAAIYACHDPEVQHDLAEAARYRRRYRRANQLHRKAADQGHTGALEMVARRRLIAGDQPGAEQLAWKAADLGAPSVLGILASLLDIAGDTTNAERLAFAASDRGNNWALRVLAERRDTANDKIGADLSPTPEN